MRKNETPRPAGAQGKGANPKRSRRTQVYPNWRQRKTARLSDTGVTEEPRAVWKLRKERFPELANPNLLVNAIPLSTERSTRRWKTRSPTWTA